MAKKKSYGQKHLFPKFYPPLTKIFFWIFWSIFIIEAYFLRATVRVRGWARVKAIVRATVILHDLILLVIFTKSLEIYQKSSSVARKARVICFSNARKREKFKNPNILTSPLSEKQSI